MRFREKAPSTAAPPLPEVRRDLLGIFTRMDNQAKRDPLLMEPYHQVHYALVALADEVVLTSGWEHSPAWRQALLEERFYNTQQAGSHFFELAKDLDHAPQDVVAIFYLCLALGFSGRYAPADHELADVKERLLARLPSKPRIMEEPPNTRAQKDRRLRGWLWSAAGAAVLLAAVVLGWNQWQSHQSTQLSVVPAPANKSAPEVAQVKPGKPEQTEPDSVKQSAAPAKLETSPAPKAEPTAQPEPAAKAEPASQQAPTPTPQPKVETAATEAPQPKASDLPKTEAAPQPATETKAKEQPAQTAQTPPAAQTSAPAIAEEPKAAAAPVQPEPAEAASAPKTAAMEKSYRVRVGVYVGPIQSGRFAEKLSKAGFPAVIEKLDRPEGKVLYVVSITPLASLAEAERVRSQVKLKFDINGVIKEN